MVLLLICGAELRVHAESKHGKFSDEKVIIWLDEILNSNEVFIPGGWVGDAKPPQTAKIYNIKTKELKDLHVTMNVPRERYETVKYDDNHIMIVGGFCPGSFERQQECRKTVESYNIKENKFTRFPDLSFGNPSIYVLSDGRVIFYDDYVGEGSIFDPKVKTYTKVPKEIIKSPNDFFWSISLLELSPNEVLVYSSHYNRSKNLVAEIWDLRDNKTIPLNIKNKIYREDKDETFKYMVGTPIKVSSDTVLFIGAGADLKDVLKLDLKTKELTLINRLQKPLAGKTILLNNEQILIHSGTLRTPKNFEDCMFFFDFPKVGKGLVWAIYDYKNNKIYKRRTTSYWYTKYIGKPIVDKNTVYFNIRFYNYKTLHKYSY